MTNDQYAELVGFLGRKFSGIELKLDDHDRQFEESRRHANVLFEQGQENLQKVAERLGAQVDAVDRRLTEVDQRLGGRIDAVDQELGTFEGALATLTVKVGNLKGAVRTLSETVRDGFADRERRIRVLEGAEPATEG